MPADKFYKIFASQMHLLPNVSSDKIQGVELHEGDWETAGSVKHWDYTLVMLGLWYALGLGRAFDLQDKKRSVRPRAPMWYRPKALRCLSKYGFTKIELQINRQYTNFDVGLWTPIVGLPRVPRGEVALIVRSVGTVPKLGVEGFHSSSLAHVSDAYWLFILLGMGWICMWGQGLGMEGLGVRLRNFRGPGGAGNWRIHIGARRCGCTSPLLEKPLVVKWILDYEKVKDEIPAPQYYQDTHLVNA
ncbi:unnamed protein product [Prunus armeniaca]